MHPQYLATRRVLVLTITLMLPAAGSAPVHAQPAADFVPVTDAMLQDPAPADWLMWRRTLDGWGYSPLEQIDRDNVGDLRLVWSRALAPGSQQGTPLVYDGVMYMPNPNDVIQAIDAATGDLNWEYRRQLPDDVEEYMGGLVTVNRNLAIHGNLIIDTANDDYVFAENVNRSRGRQQLSCYLTHQRRFARTVRAEDAENLAGVRLKRYVPIGPDGALVPLAHVGHDERCRFDTWM